MKTKRFLTKIFVTAFIAIMGIAKANNLQITGTSVSGSNITFNISWENSWYASVAPANWDAVWIFVKYQDCNTKLWAHADLSVNSADHSTASPLQVDAVADGKGVFIRRSAVGGGNIASTSVTLKMSSVSGTSNNYKVYGIEMVNVPQGSFQIGDGAGNYTYANTTVDATAQSNGLTAAQLNVSYSAAAPATFPMGYNSFYCMKYEISQEQYADFLNSLTFTQQKNHVTTDPISAAGSFAMYSGTSLQYRNGLAIQTSGSNGAIPAVFGCDATPGTVNGSNDGQNIAMNFMNWADLAAYLDWAALRPMTELEFEKVCRGPLPRISGEYPWGSTEVTANNSNNLNNALMNNETSSVTVNNGMAVYGAGVNVGLGPLRVGALATGTSGRLSSGAAYYGAMDMGGNVWERVVGTYYLTGVAYTGVLGDGALDSTGYANVTKWPSNDNSIGNGSGYRGGDWTNTSFYMRISDRYSCINMNAHNRDVNTGGRGVR